MARIGAAESVKSRLRLFFESEQISLLAAFIVLCIVLNFLTPVFLTTTNIMNVLRQASLIAIAGIGMTMVILTGEIDLSIGSLQAIVGIASVYILNKTGSIWVSFLAAILVGIIVGLTNGLIVTKAKVNSLIATLGMMTLLRGVARVTTGAVSIQASVLGFMEIGTGYIGRVPIPVIIMFALLAIAYYILNHTVFGRQIYAIGGNAEAAKLAGLPVDRVKIIVFMAGSVLAALSGFILASRMFSGQPNAGLGFEMEVIAAVILGGVSMAGGVGNLSGAVLGILILSVLSNGLVLLNVSSFWHDIVRGIVIIIAVYLDGCRKAGLLKKLLAR
jgi:ribose transport system permease protein